MSSKIHPWLYLLRDNLCEIFKATASKLNQWGTDLSFQSASLQGLCPALWTSLEDTKSIAAWLLQWNNAEPHLKKASFSLTPWFLQIYARESRLYFPPLYFCRSEITSGCNAKTVLRPQILKSENWQKGPSAYLCDQVLATKITFLAKMYYLGDKDLS